ncbi:hypothetical protein DPEC_G00331290 [Dallia pectoralis]|uniref:Uncharacterized protein n=1 Tax=Dallia pectoralis TaxID=75939 RepID=A0ACC2F915_DALPE|nr:hypothetical protein DPEC_G00331290 [Dallia pectoralis]
MPILRLWFNVEAELKQDFRLSRRAMHDLQRLLQREQDHGWGTQLEVLIYVYWLAHGLSYSVVSRVFNMPKSTVHRIIHRVAQHIMANLKRAISFPLAGELHAVGQGFVKLSGRPAFNNEDLLEPDEDADLDILEPQPPCEPLAVNESSGNATRDRLAALVSGHVQNP